MKIIDYIFFRSYTHYKRNNDLPMFTSVIVVSSIVGSITTPLWYCLLKLTYSEMPKHVYGVTFVICILVYMRYRKRKDAILNRFCYSKYNKIIPQWTYFVLLVFSMAFGISASFPIADYIDAHELNGLLTTKIISMLCVRES